MCRSFHPHHHLSAHLNRDKYLHSPRSRNYWPYKAKCSSYLGNSGQALLSIQKPPIFLSQPERQQVGKMSPVSEIFESKVTAAISAIFGGIDSVPSCSSCNFDGPLALKNFSSIVESKHVFTKALFVTLPHFS